MTVFCKSSDFESSVDTRNNISLDVIFSKQEEDPAEITVKPGDHLKIAHFDLVVEDSRFIRVGGKDVDKIFEFLFFDKRNFLKKHMGDSVVIVHGFSPLKSKDRFKIMTAMAIDLLGRYENGKFFFDFSERLRRMIKNRKKKKLSKM